MVEAAGCDGAGEDAGAEDAATEEAATEDAATEETVAACVSLDAGDEPESAVAAGVAEGGVVSRGPTREAKIQAATPTATTTPSTADRR